jgi:lipopolysaccharide/colanic/teichoic acid biosynthesis glycosyltransferase
MSKRAFDLLCSSLALLAASPAMIVIALLIKLEDGGRVFYRGERIGKERRPFWIFEFCTMVADAERVGGSSTAADDLRITRLVRRLKRYELDELPQLLNVLGET